jgi:hypothetical protein
MAITNTTDTAAIIEKRVSEIVTETLIQEAVALGTVKDFSMQVGPGMDRLDVPLFAELAVQDVSESTDMTPQSISLQTAQLSLDRHKSIPFSISDRASAQAKARLVDNTVRNGSSSLAAEIDNYMFGLVDANAANREALTANPLADIAKAKKILDSQNCPKEGRYLVASAGFVEALLTSSGIIDADKYGSSEPKQAGYVSRVYGFIVVESNSASVIDDGFQVFHMDALGFARQISPKFERERRVLGQRDDYALTHLYGGINLDPAGLRMAVFDADGV